MNFEDYTPKELEELLGIAKRRKAQFSAAFNSAQRQYIMASSGNTTIEYRQELHQNADSIKAEIDKISYGIAKIKTRLGANSVPSNGGNHSQQNFDAQSHSADRLNKRAGSLLNLLKVQITPSTECVEPNDAIIKAIFGNLSPKISVTEKHKYKKKEDSIVSNIKVQGDTPLNEHDRAVLGVIVSEQLFGNHYTTTNIIYRALIGKPAKGADSIKPSRYQRNLHH